MTDLQTAITKLERHGPARNRKLDPVPRKVVLTDDEAVALLAEFDQLYDERQEWLA